MINTQYANNRSSISLNLKNIDSTFGNIQDLLTSVKSAIVGAGNGAYIDSDRNDMAITVRSALSQLVSVANSQDASGNYIFGGYKTSTQPYTETSTGATYNGDSNQSSLQVATSRTMPTNYSGTQVFTANGVDVFTTLSNLATLLETPLTDQASRDALTNGLASANAAITSVNDGVGTLRAQVGANLSEIDILNTAGTDRATQYASTLSDLQDLDLAQATSDLAKSKTVLDAASQSYVQLANLSLFSYLK